MIAVFDGGGETGEPPQRPVADGIEINGNSGHDADLR
jgi:hypothetical protein